MSQIPGSTISSLDAIARENLSGNDLLLLENTTDDFKLSLSVLAQYLNLSGIGALADIFNVYGAKNLLPYPYDCTLQFTGQYTRDTVIGNGFITYSGAGISLSVYDNGQIVVDGEANTNVTFILATNLWLEGQYIISTENYISNNSGLYIKTGSDVTSISESTTLTLNNAYEVGIQIAAHENINNVVLKPMIRMSSVEDFAYAPFVMTNKKLTMSKMDITTLTDIIEPTKIAAGQHAIGELIVYGAEKQLARVTSAIELGDIISNGDNVANRTIAEVFAEMRQTFQDGVDTIYNAIVAKGVTPSDSTPSGCATGINTILTTIITYISNKIGTLYPGRYPVISNVESAIDDVYNKGVTDAQTTEWISDLTLETEAKYYNPPSGTVAPTGTYGLSSGSYVLLSCENVLQVMYPSTIQTDFVTVEFYNSSNTLLETVYLDFSTWHDVPSTAVKMKIYARYKMDNHVDNHTISTYKTIKCKYKAKKLR